MVWAVSSTSLKKAPRQEKEVLTKKNLAFFSIPDDGLSPNKGKYWTQKGSPLSDKHEPMELKIHSWDPSNPTGKGVKVTDRARDLKKL